MRTIPPWVSPVSREQLSPALDLCAESGSIAGPSFGCVLASGDGGIEGAHVIKAVLFDLDGTLLDIDLSDFFDSYFSSLGPVIGSLTGLPVPQAVEAVLHATSAMDTPHPGRTNKEAFDESFRDRTGVDLNSAECEEVVSRFYRQTFPLLQNGYGPHEGGLAAIAIARSLGLKVAITTNPIFPRAAIEERMRWAGLADLEFDLITSYENSSAVKPHPAYYRDAAAFLGLAPAECLMVGDDPVLDMSAADVGMRTFHVDRESSAVCDWSGTLEELVESLPRLLG